VRLAERVAPLCTLNAAQEQGAAASFGLDDDDLLVLTDYPLLLFHLRLQVRRLGDEESSAADDALWDALVG
jgi:hypothetical protein